VQAGAVARLAGVTVRALHHDDEVELRRLSDAVALAMEARQLDIPLAPDDAGPPTVIGCLYIYPGKGGTVTVKSWVRAADAALDGVLAETVAAWLADAWPFERPEHVRRGARRRARMVP
jgi:hypothetical protein